MGQRIHILKCPKCGTKNKVPDNKLANGPLCGRCNADIYEKGHRIFIEKCPDCGIEMESPIPSSKKVSCICANCASKYRSTSINSPGSSNSSDSSNETSGFKVIGIVIILLSLLLSLTGSGAVIGIPVAGVGGLAYLLIRSGITMNSGHIGLGCVSAIIIGILLFIGLLTAITGALN